MVQIQSLAPTNPDDAFSFYVEIDGHAEDANVATAVTALRRLAKRVDLLGSYMVSTGLGQQQQHGGDATPMVQVRWMSHARTSHTATAVGFALTRHRSTPGSILPTRGAKRTQYGGRWAPTERRKKRSVGSCVHFFPPRTAR